MSEQDSKIGDDTSPDGEKKKDDAAAAGATEQLSEEELDAVSGGTGITLARDKPVAILPGPNQVGEFGQNVAALSSISSSIPKGGPLGESNGGGGGSRWATFQDDVAQKTLRSALRSVVENEQLIWFERDFGVGLPIIVRKLDLKGAAQDFDHSPDLAA